MSWIKSYILPVLISIVFLVFLEIVARYYTNNLSRSYRIGYTDKEIAKIYGDSLVEDYKIVLLEQSTRWEYHPFVEYKERPRKGKFVSVSKDNVRCNANGTNDCGVKRGKGIIWLFGGSTAFGYGVKNNETIASYLENIMPDYKVVNMGYSAYYSTPERILFNELLSRGHPPEIAVFIDGMNDFYYFQVPDKSATSDRIEKLFSGSSKFISSTLNTVKNYLKESALITSLYRYINTKFRIDGQAEPQIQSDLVLQKVINRMMYNFEVRSVIGKMKGVKVLNVLQPAPGFGKGHITSNVPKYLINFHHHVNHGRGYELIDIKKFSLSNFDFLDLSKLSISGPMYIDSVHYSPAFNNEIAIKISKKLSNILSKNKN